jgi:hypothetical protein
MLSPRSSVIVCVLGLLLLVATAALRQFLNYAPRSNQDAPRSNQREQARLEHAQSYATTEERIAALHQFLRDFPTSTLRNIATLRLALALPDPTERASALQKFLEDDPPIELKQEAEDELRRMTPSLARMKAAVQDPTLVARFGVTWATEPLHPSPELGQLINSEFAKQLKYEGLDIRTIGTFDGFRIDLDGDAKDEYFVEFTRSATGNCVWGIFSDQPARFRGALFAKYFFIHARVGAWSPISYWVRNGATDAEVGREEFRQGHYTDGVARRLIHDFGCVAIAGPAGSEACGRPFLERMGVPPCTRVPYSAPFVDRLHGPPPVDRNCYVD